MTTEQLKTTAIRHVFDSYFNAYNDICRKLAKRLTFIDPPGKSRKQTRKSAESSISRAQNAAK